MRTRLPSPSPRSSRTPARGKAPFSALGRRRPNLFSEHFSLSWVMEASARDDADPTQPLAPHRLLAMAVGKRLLPKAVDRNAMRRIAREAWRVRVQVLCPIRALLRLRSTAPEWASMPMAARKRSWRLEIDALLARLKPDARMP
jgi:RNase P protein component